MKMFYIGNSRNGICNLTQFKLYKCSLANDPHFLVLKDDDGNTCKIHKTEFTPSFSISAQEATLQDQIDALTKQVEELKKQVEELKKQIQPKHQDCDKSAPWNPNGGNFIALCSGIPIPQTTPEQSYIDSGRAFSTMDAAKKANRYFRFVQRLYCLALELNEGSEPDWGNGLDYKYIVIYDHQLEQYDFESRVKSNFFVPAFKDKETVLKAIEILNKEPKYWESEE